MIECILTPELIKYINDNNCCRYYTNILMKFFQDDSEGIVILDNENVLLTSYQNIIHSQEEYGYHFLKFLDYFSYKKRVCHTGSIDPVIEKHCLNLYNHSRANHLLAYDTHLFDTYENDIKSNAISILCPEDAIKVLSKQCVVNNITNNITNGNNSPIINGNNNQII